MAPTITLQLSDPHRILVDGSPWLEVRPTVAERLVGDVELRASAVDSTTVVLGLRGRALAGIRGAHFADPQVGWSIRPLVSDLVATGVGSFGYQYMEFALPSAAGPDGAGLAPWPLRPPVAMPVLWGGPDVPTLLVGPIDHPHESIVAVPSAEWPRDDLLAGWHGDLDEIDELDSEFVVLVAEDPRAALAQYGRMVRARGGVAATAHATDPAVQGLSYWTDNGAEYYYRAAPGLGYAETIGAAVDSLAASGLPIHAVQLDSWFYPHETLRDLGDGAPIVPPSGTLRWEPRDDALPGGFAAVSVATGGLPMVVHSRHLATTSPYFTEAGFAAFADAESGHAHPMGADLIDAWMEQAAGWGVCTYEQDWLVEIFLTVRALRERAGRADDWLAEMDRSAGRRGLTLQLCMATPANLLHAVTMPRVSSVRTSMDFRYLADRQGNWGWFLHVNALARALGLATSKDVFVTTGDEWAVVETCLAALSCGPVGIGDAIGATDRDLVLRTCREDGVLVTPDVPVAAWSRSFFDEPMGSASPLVGECWTAHPAGRWHYVIACAVTEARGEIEVGLGDLGDARGPHLARRDRDGALRRLDAGGSIDVEPGSDGLDVWVVAPLLLGGECALFGDVSKYASVGARRIGQITERDGEVSFLVYGVPGSTVAVDGWGRCPDGAQPDATTGAWRHAVEVGAHGWTRVTIRTLRA